MRTQIRYKTGEVQTYEDAAPTIDIEGKSICLVDEHADVIAPDIPLSLIEKVVFIP